ncbi:hypothetical protein [Hafnia paralvei]|uniref:hypothetical protein n=1 Tax=Hafnia paralvei TaxID=546367 RepID=UPI00241CC41E|nr:hypothetical protein [Hafnia paralvei]
MNTIEQIVNFVSTLYTPKRALTTLFMIAGVVFALDTTLPYLSRWLEPSLQPVYPNYKSFIVVITLVLGISLGVVSFNFVSFIWVKISHFYSCNNNLKNKITAESIATDLANQKLIFDFKTAYNHLSESKIAILRQLLTFPTQSYQIESPEVAFLEHAGWIIPLTESSKNEKVYSINPLISPLADKKWDEEIENNVILFKKTYKEFSDMILNAMANVKAPNKIDDLYFALYSKEIEKCFDIELITPTYCTLSFKIRYKEKFEKTSNMVFQQRRGFIIKESANDDIPF